MLTDKGNPIADKFLSRSHPFPSCCQAFIIHELYVEGNAGKVPSDSALPYGDSYLHFAITTDEQVAEARVLKRAGYTAVGTYRASTGSILTAWVFVPEDQPEPEDEDDYDDDY